MGLITVIVGATAWTLGYTFGARKGRSLRDELANKAAELERRVVESQRRADTAEAKLAELSSEAGDAALAASLREIPDGRGRADLPRVLDEIAERAGLSAVVLSDERGLTVGSNHQAADFEGLAAVASGFLTLSERFEQVGAARPQVFVVHDVAQQVVVHRIFTVDGGDFLLSVVSKDQPLARLALDAALDKITGLMAQGNSAA